MAATTSPETPALANKPAGGSRLESLDALRGFDMFWIIGGDSLVQALNAWKPCDSTNWLATQLTHVKWDGFHFCDLIFPLFLFIAGVTMPYSLSGKLEQGASKGSLYWRVIRRVLLLVFLGMVCNGLLRFDWPRTRYPSVLGRIGLAWGLAAVIVLNTRVRGQIIALATLLLGYWAAMKLIPVPGVGAGVLTLKGSLAGYIDHHLIPGKLYKGVHDPEGLLATIPAVGTALLGALAGHWLRSARSPGIGRCVGLAAAGLACLGLSKLWDPWFPINKNLWTSSFVLHAGGWSLLLLSIFYLVIDVFRLRRWAFVFVVIGVNPITIYVARGRFIDFEQPAHSLFDGLLKNASPQAQAVWLAIAVLAIEWLFLYFLYRKKVFLRV